MTIFPVQACAIITDCVFCLGKVQIFVNGHKVFDESGLCYHAESLSTQSIEIQCISPSAQPSLYDVTHGKGTPLRTSYQFSNGYNYAVYTLRTPHVDAVYLCESELGSSSFVLTISFDGRCPTAPPITRPATQPS